MWGMAIGRVCLLGMAIVLSSCATALPKPSKDNKIPMCQISCPEGYLFETHNQHLCRVHNKRWFKDIMVVDEYITRGADGTAMTSAWVDMQGELYAKADVEQGSCSTVISGLIRSREAGERGQHPGTDEQGSPINPSHR